MKASAIQEANKFAISKGKVAVALNMEVRRPDVGFPSVDYQFRLSDKGSKKANDAYLKKSADITIENSKENAVDPYDRLRKLGKLRDDGVITEDEFQKEKKAILSN